MSQTLIGQVNTQQIGTTGPDPGDAGESITDSFSGFSLPASDFLTAEPALMPFAAGGTGANGQGGLTNPNPGVSGGGGGAGGVSTVQLSIAAIGALAAPQSHGLSMQAQSYGGYGADGGAGGYGGSLSNAGAGGRGGDGGAASDTFNLLSTYADTTVLVSGQTNLAVFATAGNGGTGGSGGAAGAGSGGGGGGNGGNGAAATATFSNNIAFDNNEMYVNVVAYGGQGGQGGEGGSGNAGTDVPDGRGGNGGNGGNAAAVLTGNTLNAPNITIEMMADLQPGGEGGEGGQAPGESSRGPAGTAGSYGTAQLVVTGNTITVDQPPPAYAPYFPEAGSLTLDLDITQDTYTVVQLVGSPGGNLIFSGNTIAGGGASKLTLNVLGGGVTVDTAAGRLSIDGSPGNTLTGFTSFQLDDNDTFVAGSGTYAVYFNNDPDTVVFTPTSGTVDIQYADPTNLLLDFQGFGPTLNAASLLGDITTNDGNTFINVPGAGQIELGDFEGTIPTGDLAFNAACYLAGTRILTARGEVAVERLRIGELVFTPAHGWRPIRWIGHRRLDPRLHPAPDDVRPIRFAAGSLAEGVPKRDLLVSPDHAMLVQGMLVPARLLRNDASITRETRLPVVTYFHVELDRHDILLAEGAPAESYLDTGNRDIFDNVGATALHPRLTNGCRDRSEGCLPLVTAPEQVRPIWRQLAARAGLPAGALDSPPLEREPHLVLQVGARRMPPVLAMDGRAIFALPPACAGEARLLSRAGRPHDVWPWADDRRRLGVLVRRLTVDGVTLPLDAPALGAGWWPADCGGDAAPRWTNGAAVLALPSGATLLSVELLDVGPSRSEYILNATSSDQPAWRFS